MKLKKLNNSAIILLKALDLIEGYQSVELSPRLKVIT